ncbi:MAG: FAD-dependent oxidoreductase [Chloroflexi bacterium]|nr:FAD-dependent oxidoreductase [Chloroflexota bacterium]
MAGRDTVLVLGAGVSGLSCGIELLKAGFDVRSLAKDLPPNTTSNIAAAIWYPYLCYPREKAIPWARTSFEVFEGEMLGKPETGCFEQVVVEMFDQPQSEPWWRDALPRAVERLGADELPLGYVDAYRFAGIVIETSIYMDYLVRLFLELGGKLEQQAVADFDDAFAISRVVVNCTGLGARDLCGDESVYPVRGQMLRVRAKALVEALIDDEGPNKLGLLVPRSHDLILGGTAQANNWSTKPDAEDSAGILQRAAGLWPELGEVEILEEIVGLRPARPEVRLEAEVLDGGVMVHNYGHGGAGFTLSWGCAQDVVKLVQEHG